MNIQTYFQNLMKKYGNNADVDEISGLFDDKSASVVLIIRKTDIKQKNEKIDESTFYECNP